MIEIRGVEYINRRTKLYNVDLPNFNT